MLNSSHLENLLSLSDSELRKKLSEAAISAGADKFMTAKALADMQKLRAMMSALTPEQINAVLEKMGPGAASELAKQVNNNKQ